ncbi:MAG: isopentenyl-diphosphate Delta-isomerase [Bacteroidales bacterium]
MMEKENWVQLVDEQDNPIWMMEKMEAHRLPALHRAVSILVFNSRGEWLLHQRADEKYHSGGLWTNACCTHPFVGESYEKAARRRLAEEMGVAVKGELKPAFDFVYRAKVNDELTEYEYDRVLLYTTDEEPMPNADEVQSWKYIGHQDLSVDMRKNPDDYTEWFKLIFAKCEEAGLCKSL